MLTPAPSSAVGSFRPYTPRSPVKSVWKVFREVLPVAPAGVVRYASAASDTPPSLKMLYGAQAPPEMHTGDAAVPFTCRALPILSKEKSLPFWLVKSVL